MHIYIYCCTDKILLYIYMLLFYYYIYIATSNSYGFTYDFLQYNTPFLVQPYSTIPNIHPYTPPNFLLYNNPSSPSSGTISSAIGSFIPISIAYSVNLVEGSTDLHITLSSNQNNTANLIAQSNFQVYVIYHCVYYISIYTLSYILISISYYHICTMYVCWQIYISFYLAYNAYKYIDYNCTITINTNRLSIIWSIYILFLSTSSIRLIIKSN